MKRKQMTFAMVAILLLAVGMLFGRYTFTGEFDGLYLLKGSSGKLFELKNDIMLGDYERLLARMEFQAFHERWRSKEKSGEGRPYLKYNWSSKNGGGYFISYFPDGTKFLACFGRFIDENKHPTKGLFVGGGLPTSHYEDASLKTNESGIVFFNGKEWHHLRQRTGETIFSAADPALQLKPGQWEFLGSTVLFASQFRLILKSSHLATTGKNSVRIDRYLLYHAGDRFLTLVNHLTSSGTVPLGYHFTCGNESLSGEFCGSANNGGWLRESSIVLQPGESGTMLLTIGMADNAPETGLPPEQTAELDPEELRHLLSR